MGGTFIANFLGKDLKDDPVYQDRLAKGLVSMNNEDDQQVEITPEAKRAVLIFGISIFAVVSFAMAISSTFNPLIENPILERDHAIITFMLGAATLITLLCKVDAKNILNAATFKSGMSACICVLGVAWLGTTFVAAHMEEINVFAGALLTKYPWMLAVVLFFAAMLLYSQAATTKALMPAALALGVESVAAIAAFASRERLFILPTYPTLLAAVEFDDTGSTRVGKYVFDHPFLIPGVCTICIRRGALDSSLEELSFKLLCLSKIGLQLSVLEFKRLRSRSFTCPIFPAACIVSKRCSMLPSAVWRCSRSLFLLCMVFSMRYTAGEINFIQRSFLCKRKYRHLVLVLNF